MEFNGHDVSYLTGCSLGATGKTFDTYQTLKDPFNHEIEIGLNQEANGTFDIVAASVTGADNKFEETMHMVMGYQDLAGPNQTDETTDALASGDTADLPYPTNTEFGDPDVEGDYTVPRYATVFRRIGEASSDKYAMDGANDTMWVKFRAQGERITSLALLAKCSNANDHTFTVTLVTDSGAGVPTDTTDIDGEGELAATGTQTVAHATFAAAKKWFVVTPHSTWYDKARLTIGTDYWLRITRTDGNSGDLEFYFATATGSGGYRQDYAGLYVDSNAAIAGATPDTDSEAIHYIKFKTTEGLKVVVYDYIDLAETSGVKWTFNKVILDSVTPSFANKQATRASISWRCSEWTFDSI